ncbi:MAG: transcription-repair coupling factor [Legionellales bacterium]|nr:transcription-repair coupling factor [Legionellales bacterium]
MPINIPLTNHPTDYWKNLHNCSRGLYITNFFKEHQRPILAITSSVLDSINLVTTLKFFLDEKDYPKIMLFPDRETLPYDQLSPHKDITSERLSILSKITNTEKYILVISINTLMNLLPPKEFTSKYSFDMELGQILDLESFKLELSKSGYHCVNKVMEHGEYCIKGGILDLFPMGHKAPYRIELFDNTIETIREFNPETQISKNKIDFIKIMPAHEYQLDKFSIDIFKTKYKNEFITNPKDCGIYQSITNKLPAPGAEYYLPLFFERTSNLLDYLQENTIIIHTDNILESSKDFFEQIKERYNSLKIDKYRSLLKPSSAFLTQENLFSKINEYKNIQIQNDTISHDNALDFKCSTINNFNIDVHQDYPMQIVKDFITNSKYRTLIVADSLGRQEIILSLFASIELAPQITSNWQSFLESQGDICITTGKISHGCTLNEENINIITEYELFGYESHLPSRRSTQTIDSKYILKNLVELDIGEYVVHIDYGISIYRGLKTIATNNINAEFINLEFADNAMIYVPITALHLISRYGGANSENIALSKLGTKSWSKEKEKALRQIHDTAAELLNIYALRQKSKGLHFTINHQDYMKFCAKFGYEETIDQTKACQDVLDDMLSNKLMDRLICGDVGFGKTEVAMRAAYIAIKNNKQVAVLVPTTLLSEQHYKNFIDRFAGFDVAIESISRFKNAKEKQQILQNLKTGKINIIIGTHSLIQQNIDFFALGLLIIDEEHRFGVKQKEFIKSRKSNIDIISLTATPIPRTLNMSLNGIRDISIIATPPKSRLAIKTFTMQKSESIIREAILRELYRGGQVFYLHNNIQTMQSTYNFINKLVPEAKIKIAHGKMPEKELEQIMSDFYHTNFNVLLCTTIIETGIDVPTANTIIVDRSDKYGLAQLHQLRGRVGRSHHQAYAYFMLPDEKLITKDAKKRIEAITSLNDLGTGFNLASHDLDIRGSGEILGQEQSGSIQKIGLSLYSELLEQTVKSFKRGEKNIDIREMFEKCEINLNTTAIIPETYIYDVKERLVIYKRIANCQNYRELDDIQVELINRFGLLPDELKNLFEISKMKLNINSLGIKKIDISQNGGHLIFSDNPNINEDKIIQLITKHPKNYKLDTPNKLLIKKDLPNLSDKITIIQQLIQK